MLSTATFTQHERVLEAAACARTLAMREYSDVLDGDDHQYVDIVLEGGGVLGIALVGYSYILEEAGIRFLGIGGTSAGAINALFLAALGEKRDAKTVRTIELLANLDLNSFQDGGLDVLGLAAAAKRKRWLNVGWRLPRLFSRLRRRHGVHSGQAFFDWIASELARAGITTSAQLKARATTPPSDLRHRDPMRVLTAAQTSSTLAFVAAEITTETKVEFPRMAELFWADPDAINPAHFIRASMSIPFFFEPYVVDQLPRSGRWAELAHFHGPIPERGIFVDGGIMSNFPIDIFHDHSHVPVTPTFGVKLDLDRDSGHEVNGLGSLGMAIFNSARHTLDLDFLMKNPDYRHLVGYINTTPHNWLNFSMSNADKIDLFCRGAEAAVKFLEGFDWQNYKQTRADLIRANAHGVRVPAKATSSTERLVPAGG